ncbi:MAG: hemolysin family protein [Alphaproteobacteria bacterium]
MTDFPPNSTNPLSVGEPLGDHRGGFWRRLRGMLRLRGNESSVREVIEELIEEPGTEDEAIGADEGVLITNILKLHDLTADDVMIPRADIVAVEQSEELHAVADLIAREAHSRLPLYHEQLDQVVGFVHIKDVLAALRSNPRQKVRDLSRDILFAAPSIRVLDLLLEMRAQRTHMAIVIDEFGGVDGLVTIEDLVEEIVGEIEDEHDEAGPVITVDPGGSILADARVEVGELEERIGAFLTQEEREESDTLGGVVFSLVDRVPRRSEVVTHKSGVEFEVVDADARRIKRLRVRDLRDSEDGETNPSSEK